jgi:hypothetical protein
VDWPPPEGASVGSALAEVRGHAGLRGQRGHEVVIVLDLSDSTLQYSGVDLDGDGPGGTTRPELLAWLSEQPGVRDGLVQRLRESDFEDSILAAELEAARALLARLEPRTFRTGIVVFSDRARVVAPVGTPPAALQRALEEVGRSFFEDLHGTHFADAVRTAHRALVPAPPPPPRPPKKSFWERLAGADEPPPPPPPPPAPPDRERSILFLSDGAPTLPVHGARAAEHALDAVRAAAADGVRLYSFAIGPEAEQALVVYREMAALGGGRFERIERPGDAPARLRRVDLADLEELRIENLRTNEEARAQRVFPDGSFDAFVALEPGANRLRFSARASDGTLQRVERSVVLEEASVEAGSREDPQALLEELRRRTREMELWAEVERGRRATVREIDLRPEAAPAAEKLPPP